MSPGRWQWTFVFRPSQRNSFSGVGLIELETGLVRHTLYKVFSSMQLDPSCGHFEVPDLIDLVPPFTVHGLHIERSCIHPGSGMPGLIFPSVFCCIDVHPYSPGESNLSNLRCKQNPNGTNVMIVNRFPTRSVQSK